MGWEDDAKAQAETEQSRKAARIAARKAKRAHQDAVIESAMGGAMARAVTVLTTFKELFGKRFVATRSIKGDPAALQEFGIKASDDMTRRVEVVRVAKDRVEILVDGVKYECAIVFNPELGRIAPDPRPTRFPGQGRAMHGRHSEEFATGRAFDTGQYLGAVAVEWAKKHGYTRVD
jgi:hypothetical protein